MNKIRWYLLAGTLLAAVLGSGGTDPLAVLAVHGLVIVLMAWESVLPFGSAGLPARVSGPFLGFGAVALVGAASASYGYAAFLCLQEIALFSAVAWLSYRYGLGFRTVLFKVLVGGGVLESGYAIVRRVFLGEWRSPGTFFNPNHLAAWLVVVLLLLAGERSRPAASGTGLWKRGAAGAVLFAGIVLSGSRGALAGLAAGGVYLLSRAWRSMNRRERQAVAVVGLLLLLVVSGALVVRFQGPDRFAFQRVSIWKGTGGMILDHPWLGVGPGQFDWAAENYQFPDNEPPLNYDHRFDQSHSDWLRLPAEFGVVGLVCVLAAAVGFLKGLRSRREEGEPPVGATGESAALLALLVQSMFQNLSHSPGVYLAAAGLLGVLAAGSTASGTPAPAKEKPASVPIFRFLVPGVLAVLFLVGDVGPWLADGLARTARGADAVPRLQAAIRLNRLQPRFHMQLAEEYLRQKDRPLLDRYLAARSEGEAAMRLHPRSGELARRMARIEAAGCRKLFQDRASRERARRWYQEAERLLPYRPLVPLEAAEFLLGVSDPAGAAAAADRVLALEPNAVTPRILKAAALARLPGNSADREIARLRREASRLEKEYAGSADSGKMARLLLRVDPDWKSGISVSTPGTAGGEGERWN